jgi:hypothetical protein
MGPGSEAGATMLCCASARHSPRPLIGGHEENSSNARTNAAARLICMSGGARRAPADKNRNGGDVLVICPTCQNVVTGSLKASMPAALFYFAWGCFRYFRFRVGKGAPWRRAHHASSSEMVGTLSPSAFALRAMADAVALRATAEALLTQLCQLSGFFPCFPAGYRQNADRIRGDEMTL